MPKKKQYQIVHARVEVLSGGPEPGIVVAELELQPQTAKGKLFSSPSKNSMACRQYSRQKLPYSTGS